MRLLRAILVASLLVSVSPGCGPGDGDPNPALKRPEASPEFKRAPAKEKAKAAAGHSPGR